jgi:hypothetical protein
VGGTGTNIAVKGTASGGTDNFGGHFTGKGYFSDKVGIGTAAPGALLDIAGSNWDLVGTEGDLRIGNPSYRLKMGIAVGGGGSGDATIAAQGGTNRLFLGAGTTAEEHRTVSLTGSNVGIGTITPTARLDVEGNSASTVTVADVTVAYVGTSDVIAVNGTSTPADGYGYGVYGTGGYVGVRGINSGGAHIGGSYGVYGYATGTAGQRYGVYGSAANPGGSTAYGVYGTASGATNNWAGYFSGKTYVSSAGLLVGTTTAATGYMVSVNGKIMCEELKVQDNGSWPDYVFESTYDLPSLAEVDAHIRANKHLPGVPTAQTVCEEGIEVGNMQKILLEKIEQLTLYMIDADKRIKALEAENASLKSGN